MSQFLPIVVEDHLLWPDGTISVDPDSIVSYILRMSSETHGIEKLYVTSITPEILAYNSISDHELKIKTECNVKFPPEWKLPGQYKYDLNLEDYLIGLVDRIEKDDLYEKRVERLSTEIWMFKQLKLEDVLRTLIYVIDVMKEKKVIWGVGRGSSCSSYLLYLLGLHEVDSVKYDIEITDFIKL
jgi:DNA polymerase III alpha subunit